jgi:hypothetical protein
MNRSFVSIARRRGSRKTAENCGSSVSSLVDRRMDEKVLASMRCCHLREMTAYGANGRSR